MLLRMEGWGGGHLSPLPPQSSSPATRRTASTELFLLLTDQADDSSVFSPLPHVYPPPFTSTPPPNQHPPSKKSDLHLLSSRGSDIAGVKHQKKCGCVLVNETPVCVRVCVSAPCTPRPSRCRCQQREIARSALFSAPQLLLFLFVFLRYHSVKATVSFPHRVV